MKEYILTVIAGQLLMLSAFSPVNCSDEPENTQSNKQEKQQPEQNSDSDSDSDSKTAKKGNDSSGMIEFSAKTVKGNSLSSEDLKGNVVLFNYWGTWCPPCVKEIPHFQETYSEYTDDGFTIVGIAVPQGGTGGKSDVKSFMKDKGMTYPVIMMDNAPNKEVQKRFGKINAVPTSILLDRKGNHVETFVGYTEKETLVNAIKPLLKKNE